MKKYKPNKEDIATIKRLSKRFLVYQKSKDIPLNEFNGKTLREYRDFSKKLFILRPTSYIAREKLAMGDVLTLLWKKYVRRAISSDYNIVGFSANNYKKGQEVKIKVTK